MIVIVVWIYCVGFLFVSFWYGGVILAYFGFVSTCLWFCVLIDDFDVV